MKIFLLAAGYGSRLGRHTENLPKPCLKIDSYSIIQKLAMQLNVYFPDAEFIVNLHYLPSFIIEDIFQIEMNFMVRFSYERNLLGPARSLHLISESLNDDILVVHSDLVLSNQGVEAFSSFIRENAKNSVIVGHHRPSNLIRNRFKTIEGFAYDLAESTSNDQELWSYLVDSGLYFISRHDLGSLPKFEIGQSIFSGPMRSIALTSKLKYFEWSYERIAVDSEVSLLEARALAW